MPRHVPRPEPLRLHTMPRLLLGRRIPVISLESTEPGARETLRAVLRAVVIKHSKNQNEIAWAAGIRADSLSHILTSDADFSLTTFDRIMDAAGVELLATWRTKEPGE